MTSKVLNSNIKKRKKQVKLEQSKIPSFGFKSALVIVLTAALSSFFLPYILAMFGANVKVTTLICNATFISLAVCYCHYFIETDKGFSKYFVRLYICFFIAIAIINYFWLFIGLYM